MKPAQAMFTSRNNCIELRCSFEWHHFSVGELVQVPNIDVASETVLVRVESLLKNGEIHTIDPILQHRATGGLQG